MLACYTDETIEVRALNVTMPSNVQIVWRSQWVDATLYLERRDGVYADDAKKWSRVQFGREDGALGPLATRGVVEVDWSGVW